MTQKAIPMIVMSLILTSIAYAQTGLFSSTGSGTFLTFGIVVIVVVIVIKAVIDAIRKKK